MATTRLIIMAKEIVKPNCFKYCPTVPLRNEIGVKTEITTALMATTAIKISREEAIEASIGFIPLSILR